jgi:hypothetical protein
MPLRARILLPHFPRHTPKRTLALRALPAPHGVSSPVEQPTMATLEGGAHHNRAELLSVLC